MHVDAPATTVGPASAAAREWRRAALLLGAGLLALGGIFNQEVAVAVQTWIDSTAYNHCFLVIPIAVYLVWDRRFDLDGIAIRPCPAAIIPAVPLALVWLLAERLGIMEGRQLAAMTFVELLFLAVLGRQLWRAVAGPLLYLYFLVPFGEFLTPVLQDITTWFIDGGLGLLGVPAYIDGYVIEIPQGTFFVAEACAGLRFLIASLAFGSLYALTMYRSPIRRVVFIVVSIVVPVIANGFRAIGIVYLGYVLDSARAAAADHVIYGWLFFSFVILLLIVLGLPFRQDDMTTRPAPAGRQRAPIRQPGWRVAATAAAGLVGVACVSPALSAGLSIASRTPPVTAGGIVPGPGCTASAPPVSDAGSPAVRSQRMTCGEMAMDVRWEALSPRSTAAAVMQARWELSRPVRTEGLSEAWLQAGDGKPTDWLIMRSSDLDSMLAVAVWIDGKPVRPGLRMRLRMALDSLLGASHAPLVMTVAPAVDWQALTDTERGIVGTRLAEVLGSGSALDQSAGASTSLR